MKYAEKVMDLMSAYPNREFKMINLIRYVNPKATPKQNRAIRMGILRVLEPLIESKQIEVVKVCDAPQSKRYVWRN